MTLVPQSIEMVKKRTLTKPFDTKDLIREVLKRPALWQPHHADFNNRYLRAEYWRDIASKVVPEFAESKEKVRLVAAVASRWKTARMGLIRNLRLGHSYIYHNDMSFLVPIVKETLAEERSKHVTFRSNSEEPPNQRPTRGRARKQTDHVSQMQLRLRSTAPDTTWEQMLGKETESTLVSPASTFTIRTTPSVIRAITGTGHYVTSTSTTATATRPSTAATALHQAVAAARRADTYRVTTTTATTTTTTTTTTAPTSSTQTNMASPTLRSITKTAPQSPQALPSSSSSASSAATAQTISTTTTAQTDTPTPDEPAVAHEPLDEAADDDMEYSNDDILAKEEVISICSDLSDELDVKLLAATPFRNLHQYHDVGSPVTPPQTVVHAYDARDNSTSRSQEFLATLPHRRASTSSCGTPNVPSGTPHTTAEAMPRDSGCGSSTSSVVLSMGPRGPASLAGETTSMGDLRGFSDSGSGVSAGGGGGAADRSTLALANPSNANVSEAHSCSGVMGGPERYSGGSFGPIISSCRGSASLDSSNANDPDQAFFDSIKPIIRNWSVDKKLDFQFEVLGLLKNFRGQQ